MAFNKKIFNNEIDVISDLGVGGNFEFGLLTTAGAERLFQAIGAETNISISLSPKGIGTLQAPTGYEANILNVRDLVNKGYVDTKVAGKGMSEILITPGLEQNGYAISWDNTAGNFTLAPSAATKLYGSGLEDSFNTVKLGGTPLDRHTNIEGAGTFNLSLGTPISKVLDFVINAVQKAEIVGGTASLTLNGASPVVLSGGAAASTFSIDAGGGLLITDNQGGSSKRGLRGAADYSGMIQDNDYAQRIYIDNRLGGKLVSNLIKNPGIGQNNHAVIWNQTLGQFTLANVSSDSVSTVPKKQKFIGNGSITAWNVTAGTILYLNIVEINGKIQTEGEDFTRSGQVITISPPLPDTYELNVYFWEDLNVGGGGEEGGGGTVQNGHFLFDSSTTEADPGDGKVRINGIDFAATTELYIDENTIEGHSIGEAIQDMAFNDEIRLQVSADDDNNVVFKLTAMPINQGGWWLLPVLCARAIGPLFPDGEDLVVILLFGGPTGAEINIDGGTASSIYNTIPDMDGGTALG